MSFLDKIEKLSDASVMTYRLVDGSYIMAEEVDYDFEDKIIFIINPVKILEKPGGYQFTSWTITEPSQVITLKERMIMAQAAAPTTLKHNYFQFGLLKMAKEQLTSNEFDEIIQLLFPVVDSKDSDDDHGFDFNKPYKVNKIKKEEEDEEDENPWDRY